MQPRLQTSIRFVIVVVLALLACGCNFPGLGTTLATSAPPTPGTNPQASITPFMPDPPTATPGPVKVWISPNLPDELIGPVEGITSVSGRGVEFVNDRQAADLRVEENPVIAKSNWIFALVAPFPTTLDSLPLEELQSLWSGAEDAVHTLLVSDQMVPLLEVIFGSPSGQNVRVLDQDNLFEVAWEIEDALLIIPFDSLEPSWKVIAIDGVSPIHKDLIADVYPLSVRFGVSGEESLVASFLNSFSWPISNRDPGKLTIVAVTGVTALTRATAWRMSNEGIDYPAEKIGSWLKGADITHISNEVSFLETCPPPKPDRVGLTFCSDPDYIQLLETIGADVIELTGNHIKDYGEESLTYTLDLYDELGFQYFGGGADLEDALKPALFEHNGNRIAFFGCNSAGPPAVWAKESSPGALPCDADGLLEVVGKLKEDGYLPIFTFQWNEYYQPKPSTEQREDFRGAIDAGAVVVSGSQAHQPQIYELHGDGLIHYGLGNLFFDQMWSLATRQEFIDLHVFYDGRYISTEVLTAMLEDYAQPRPMTEEERLKFLKAIFSATEW